MTKDPLPLVKSYKRRSAHHFPLHSLRSTFLSFNPRSSSVKSNPKMASPKSSIMDEKPNLESFYRDLSGVAIAALAVHVSWTLPSPDDHFVVWLVSVMPSILTGFLLLTLLFDAANNARYTQFFTILTTSTWSEPTGPRASGNPDREDRHLLNIQVIAWTASLGVSIDVVYIWYLLCQAVWDDIGKTEPIGLLVLVTLITGFSGFLLALTWMPVCALANIKQRGGGELSPESSEDGHRDSSPELQTLIAAAEAYEKELRSNLNLPYYEYPRKDAIRAVLGMLRKW